MANLKMFLSNWFSKVNPNNSFTLLSISEHDKIKKRSCEDLKKPINICEKKSCKTLVILSEFFWFNRSTLISFKSITIFVHISISTHPNTNNHFFPKDYLIICNVEEKSKWHLITLKISINLLTNSIYSIFITQYLST